MMLCCGPTAGRHPNHRVIGVVHRACSAPLRAVVKVVRDRTTPPWKCTLCITHTTQHPHRTRWHILKHSDTPCIVPRCMVSPQHTARTMPHAIHCASCTTHHTSSTVQRVQRTRHRVLCSGHNAPDIVYCAAGTTHQTSCTVQRAAHTSMLAQQTAHIRLRTSDCARQTAHNRLHTSE